MRHVLALTVLVGGCATAHGPLVPHDVMNRPSLQLFTPYGFGHGCPVDDAIFTARHLVQPSPQMPPTGVTFRDEAGVVRVARTLGTSWAEDVAIIDPGGAVLTYYEMGPEPTPGEVVYWWEYAQVAGPDILRAKLRGAPLLRAPAGHLVLSESPVPGASGSCAFNAQGQVVGIVVWGNPEMGFAIVAPLITVQ